MHTVNWLAVLVAGLAYFFLGYLWYTFLFGRRWARALGMNPDASKKEEMQRDMMKKLPWSFLGNLVAAAFVALLVSYAHANGDAMRAATEWRPIEMAVIWSPRTMRTHRYSAQGSPVRRVPWSGRRVPLVWCRCRGCRRRRRWTGCRRSTG